MASPHGIRAGKAFVELSADNSKLVRGLKRANARIKAFGANVRKVGASLVKVGAVMGGGLLAATKVFADFERQMANVSTMLEQPERHMAGLTKGIREMSVKFGESTETLAAGLYDILSASIPAEKALDVLAVSARAAKAGLTDTGVAADAITTILNSYGMSADKAGEVSDLLFTVVKRGKTTFGELAPQIGMVASTAASAGVGLDELGASLAVLTRNGVKTENAVTAVNQIILSFLKPSSDASKYARELGFEMSSATLKAEGLQGVFERIKDLPPDAIAKLFPNARALRGVIPALKNMKGFVADVEAMRAKAGATQAAYAKMTGTLSHAFGQLKQSVVGVLSVIGEALAPMFKRLAGDIRANVGQIVGWIRANKDAIIQTLKVTAAIAGIVERRLMRNLTFGYRSQKAVLSRVRGRIDFLHTERHQLLARGMVACRFENLTVDTPRNRFVRGALDRIAGIVQRPEVGHRCRALSASLKRLGVSGETPTRAEISTDRYGRHDANDQFMVAAARLAFDLALPTEAPGSEAMALPDRYVHWVRRLYEKAVGGFYDVVLSPKGWQVGMGKTYRWPIKQKTSGIDSILPGMRTDIILDDRGTGRRIVIDTKFTSITAPGRFREETLKSGYLYQIYAYLRSQEGSGDPLSDHAAGLLLHPSVGEMVDETVVIQGHAIRFATVDLAAATGEIREQLLQMVEFRVWESVLSTDR